MKTIADYEIDATVERLRASARGSRRTAADVYYDDGGEAGRLIRMAERLESLADEIERGTA
ncbi:hypothetical protein [Chromohalobacter nigrandesensis]|uniref:hypothetical protein n=1 Tax=Chromohalobacter nigrandesensis TaxID=119863 RepID=UPI001FF6CBD7|nr:hypothetical protein [Chromohalobacter nigrandesensis]MCK0745027.1 hypothetical protein [Chromohalobacter nigrandesensis]